MNANVYDITGKQVKKVELPEEMFNYSVDPKLLTQAIRVYQARQRQSTSKVQSRGEVSRTKAKVWRQKGTGRARHGSRNAPIFVGGGVAHGPNALDNYNLKINKKMKRLALFGTLSSKLASNNLKIISGFSEIEPKTKFAQTALEATINFKKGDKVLIVLPGASENLLRAGKNLEGLTLTQASRLNFYEILNHNHLILLEESIGVLKSTFMDQNFDSQEITEQKPVAKINKKITKPKEA